MTAKLVDLFVYPIKGLSAQRLCSVALRTGQGFPLDRAFGFARPDSGFEPENPTPLPKSKFVVLAKDAALAKLQTSYDTDLTRLNFRVGADETTFDISTDEGRESAANFLARFLEYPPSMQPTLFSAAPHKFTDVSVISPSLMNAVSLINLDSVSALSSAIGKPVEARRLRGNILVSGLPAFSELDLIGKDITIGDVTFTVVQHTKRCPATQVNPNTAERDLDIPALLRQHFGHPNLGVYLDVRSDGSLQPGDRVSIK